MKWRWWRTAEEKAAEFASDRMSEDDATFISNCGLPDTLLASRVALAVRRSVANYGMIESEFIRADDLYPDQLIELSGWDSIDFVGWVLELEKELAIPIPGDAFHELYHSRKLTFSVKELAQVVHNFMLHRQ